MKKYTYAEIANDWKLWQEYADPSGRCTETWFDSTPVTELIAFMEACFGKEEIKA